jgi:hypothetical protein
MGMEKTHEKTIVTWNNDICLGKRWTTISGEVDLQLSVTGPEWLFNGGHGMACPNMLAIRNPHHRNPYCLPSGNLT